MYVSRYTEARSCNHCRSGKAIGITCSNCVFVALVNRHAKRMRSTILASVGCPALNYFCTLTHKRQDFRGGEKLSDTKCVLISCTTFVWDISRCKKNWARCDQKCILVFTSSTRYSCQEFNKTWIFYADFRKILEYQTLWKSVQWKPNCYIAVVK